MSSNLVQYLWIAIAGGIFGFFFCFAIGSNDVANAFATSVASKSITLKQAVITASIFQFCGVLFLGASVTSTVKGKIFDATQYEDDPEIVMLGMFTSLVAASFMTMVSTYLALPVSTTHTAIGCIIGFTIAAEGFSSVNWDVTTNIFISWVAAPLLTGTIGYFIFLFIRYFILLSDNPFRRGYYMFPFVIFVTVGINLFFIFNKGTQNFTYFQENVYDDKWVIPTSFGIGAVTGFLWLWPVGPLVKKKMEINRAARAMTEHAGSVAAGPSTTPAAVHPVCSIGDPMLSSIGSHRERSGTRLAFGDPMLSSIGSHRERRGMRLAENISPAASIRSIGSSIGSHKERRGSHLFEYDPEEGAIKFAVAESVKSLKLTIDSQAELSSSESESEEELTQHATNIDETQRASKGTTTKKKGKTKKRKKKNFLIRFEEATYKQNLEEQCFQESRTTAECWQNATKYDSDVEQLFTYVQVFTASLSSFANGANAIANAIGPVAAIFDIYQTGQLNPEAPVQKWILAYGGLAMSLGLLLYGYNVMKTIGFKLTAQSPTRGSSASLASSLMVVTASYIGIPVSTTQCIVGAVAGIGLVEGQKNVQWLQLGKCVVGWVLVFVAAAIMSAILFALCAYSPSLVAA